MRNLSEIARVVGWGTIVDGELCEFSGTRATGYVEVHGEPGDMIPCNLRLIRKSIPDPIADVMAAVIRAETAKQTERT